MVKQYQIIYEGGEAEFIEKKSRFLATVRPVKTEDDALDFIETMKKKYWNATHNCWAYVIGERGQLQRCSDDGEPSGTAGRPMLDVLLGEEVRDVAVVVTRYFGGTLLGTGGLVRAYSHSVKIGLEASTIIAKTFGYHILLRTDYTGLGKIQYILGQRQIPIVNSIYTDSVELELLVAEEEWSHVKAELTEGTNGQASMEVTEECYFAEINGVMQIL